LAPITFACVVAAAQSFAVPQAALWTILDAEHGKVGACVRQANGTHDCGPGQVNAETWVPHLAKILKRPIPTIFYQLRDNGCFNAYASAYILRIKIDEAKGNIWDGMGRYNSATPSLKNAYQTRLVEAYRHLAE
jgi:hypothetical protein